jgi:hypothetical protein
MKIMKKMINQNKSDKLIKENDCKYNWRIVFTVKRRFEKRAA